MTIYALTYTIGYETGYKKLIGIYSTVDKLAEAKWKDIHKNFGFEHNYSIHEIQVDKTINQIYQEW